MYRLKLFLLGTCAFVAMLVSLSSLTFAVDRVTIGGGPIGGTFYVLSTGFAKILNEDVGLSASVEVNAGSAHNVQLVSAGKVDFGITNAGILYHGQRGTGWAKGKKYENARVIMAMQLSYIHFWTLKKTDIRSINDLNGKIVNLSARGSGADLVGRDILDEFGIKPERITNLGHNDANQNMMDGLVSVALNAGGLPHPAVAALSTTHNVLQFGLVGKQADAFQKTHGYLIKASIPAGTYKGQNEPVPTLGDWNVMLANKDLPADLVYKILDQTFKNIEKWVAMHKSAKETKPENIRDLTQYPLHPGAEKYYKDKGIL